MSNPDAGKPAAVRQPCSVVSGILFSRKPCPETTAFTCVRCAKPVCIKHGVVQTDKRLLCPSCDAYTSRDHDSDDRWRTRHRNTDRDRTETDRTVPVAAGTGAGAGTQAGSELFGEEDRAGLSPDEGWHGAEAPGDADAADAAGFDAS